MAEERKTGSEIGNVNPHQQGWRVQVKLENVTEKGPLRRSKRQANKDLKSMQALPRSEMAGPVFHLWEP